MYVSIMALHFKCLSSDNSGYYISREVVFGGPDLFMVYAYSFVFVPIYASNNF